MKKQKGCKNKCEVLHINFEEDNEELETVSNDVFEDMTDKSKIGVKKQKIKPSTKNCDKSQRNNQAQITSLVRKSKYVVRSKLTKNQIMLTTNGP